MRTERPQKVGEKHICHQRLYDGAARGSSEPTLSYKIGDGRYKFSVRSLTPSTSTRPQHPRQGLRNSHVRLLPWPDWV